MTNTERLIQAKTMTVRQRALWFRTLAELQATFLRIEMDTIHWTPIFDREEAFVLLGRNVAQVKRNKQNVVSLDPSFIYRGFEHGWPGFSALLPSTNNELSMLFEALMSKYNEDGTCRYAT